MTHLPPREDHRQGSFLALKASRKSSSDGLYFFENTHSSPDLLCSPKHSRRQKAGAKSRLFLRSLYSTTESRKLPDRSANSLQIQGNILVKTQHLKYCYLTPSLLSTKNGALGSPKMDKMKNVSTSSKQRNTQSQYLKLGGKANACTRWSVAMHRGSCQAFTLSATVTSNLPAKAIPSMLQ